jgi:IclR family transcriptional regulator, KDG regulon repressor
VSEQLTSVERTLRVLEAFSYATPVMGVSEISRKVGIGKSSVHRSLSTLLQYGYVAKTADDRYRLGLKLHEMGNLVVSGIRLHEVAHAPLETLRSQCKETVHLAVLDGTDVVYIERFESAGLARMLHRIGLRVPVSVTSSGKCLVAFGEPDRTEEIIAAGLVRRGPRSITSAKLFRDVIAKVRADGYAVSVEENEAKLSSIGAPVFGGNRACIASVSVVGPMLRINSELLPKYVRMVRTCAHEISVAMGYDGPMPPTR